MDKRHVKRTSVRYRQSYAMVDRIKERLILTMLYGKSKKKMEENQTITSKMLSTKKTDFFFKENGNTVKCEKMHSI